MSLLLSAIALAAASPTAAPASTPAPAPAPAQAPMKKCCCEKMERPMACCDEHKAEPGGHDAHSDHGMNH